MDRCLFCDPEEGSRHMLETFGLRVGPIAWSRSFFIMPMVGAGAEGYLLLVSRKHYHSMAELPIEQFAELSRLLPLVRAEVGKAFGNPIVFEHGSTCHNLSCLIDHAHLHIVPVPAGFSLREDIERDHPLLRLRRFEDLSLWATGGAGRAFYDFEDGARLDGYDPERERFAGYLYYEEQDGTGYVHELRSVDGFQPQYLRRLLLARMGRSVWDWRRNIDQGQVDEAVRRLGGMQEAIDRGRPA
ncbi:MAG: hypothetical protein FJ149_10665 [Euryarchaeota archaeon]|nr:hypothetical protein [Euryarchaeota archaeon]